MQQKQSTIEYNHVTLERPTATIEKHLSNQTEQYDEDFEQEDAKL